MAAALKETKLTLQDGLKTGEGAKDSPISASVRDGRRKAAAFGLTRARARTFTEVVADPKTGAIVKSEKITDNDELNDAADQKAAMAKATGVRLLPRQGCRRQR